MKSEGKWTLAALLIPVLQAASGTSWYWVLGAAAVCGLLCYGVKLDTGEEPEWVKAVQWLWSTWILAEMLFRAGSCWPGGEQTEHIPLLLLVLSGRMAIKGRKRNQQAAGALWWMLLLLLIPVGVAAVREIRPGNLRWQKQDPVLTAMLLLPAMNRKQGNGLWLPSLAASLAVCGVLGKAAAENPIYEMSRSMSLFGTVKRFESLAAVGMTLGYFLSLSYVMVNRGRTQKGILLMAAAAALWYVAGLRMTGEWLTAGTVGAEAILPMMSSLKRNVKNTGKGVDK